jgi:hypothetical protein
MFPLKCTSTRFHAHNLNTKEEEEEEEEEEESS